MLESNQTQFGKGGSGARVGIAADEASAAEEEDHFPLSRAHPIEFGDCMFAGEEAEIMTFVPGDDRLLIVYDDAVTPPPEVEIRASMGLYHVYVGGVLRVALMSGGPISSADVAVVGQSLFVRPRPG